MIKEKRMKLGYTQIQIANQLGISLRQYARIDKEESLPRRDILSKMIIALELNDEEIGRYIRNIVA